MSLLSPMKKTERRTACALRRARRLSTGDEEKASGEARIELVVFLMESTERNSPAIPRTDREREEDAPAGSTALASCSDVSVCKYKSECT